MPKYNQKNINKVCFSCENAITGSNLLINPKVNLPVCKACKGTDKEKKAEDDILKSLAEDFVCGCI